MLRALFELAAVKLYLDVHVVIHAPHGVYDALDAVHRDAHMVLHGHAAKQHGYSLLRVEEAVFIDSAAVLEAGVDLPAAGGIVDTRHGIARDGEHVHLFRGEVDRDKH